MSFKPLQKPEDMTLECLGNGLTYRDIRNLYWAQQETDDPKLIADINRQFIDFLLKLAEDDEMFQQLRFDEEEVNGLKTRREITNEMRLKLRIYAEGIARETFGT